MSGGSGPSPSIPIGASSGRGVAGAARVAADADARRAAGRLGVGVRPAPAALFGALAPGSPSPKDLKRASTLYAPSEAQVTASASLSHTARQLSSRSQD